MFCLWCRSFSEHIFDIGPHTRVRVQSRTGGRGAGRAGRAGGGARAGPSQRNAIVGELARHFFLNSGQTSFVYNLHCKDSAILGTWQRSL